MDLPFSPTLFSEIDAFQQLQDYEVENKASWGAEKVVLMWAAGKGHQHIGTPIGTDHVRDSLKAEKELGHLSIDLEDFMDRKNGHIILGALAVRGYGDETSDGRLKISPKGFLAGRVLIKTNKLTSNDKYTFWGSVWWVIFGAVGLLLVLQIINSFFDFKKNWLPEDKAPNYCRKERILIR